MHLVQSKAFDSVNHKYLAVVMEATSLGPNFRHWITALCSDIKSVVIRVNSFFSKLFQIEFLFCQRCSLSTAVCTGF